MPRSSGNASTLPAGWKRTDYAFPVFTGFGSGATSVCRFFSGSAFAPASSHFYTPYPGECDAVSSNPDWQFESIAFYLRMPDNAGHGDGTAPGERTRSIAPTTR